MAAAKICTLLALLALASFGGARAVAITWGFPSQIDGQSAYPPVYITTGQSLTLDWAGMIPHGVYLLSPGAGVGCPSAFNTAGPGLVYPVGTSGTYTFNSTSPGEYNLACPVGMHCKMGMLLQIHVSAGSVPAGAPSLAPVMAPTGAPGTAPA